MSGGTKTGTVVYCDLCPPGTKYLKSNRAKHRRSLKHTNAELAAGVINTMDALVKATLPRHIARSVINISAK